MIDLMIGNYPSFSISGIQLPFDFPNIGKEFKFKGIVKLDHIREEGPVFTFEIRKIDFPGVDFDVGTVKERKRKKTKAIGISDESAPQDKHERYGYVVKVM